MNRRRIKPEHIKAFERSLIAEERSAGTAEKYTRALRALCAWLEDGDVTREHMAAWKEHLRGAGYAASSINGMLSAANSFFRFMGWEGCGTKFLRIQRRAFREEGRELTREEYRALLQTARENGRRRLELVMETICATGIRVSELRHITLEAARRGRAEISLKSKVRTILLPGKLCRKLLKYAKKKRIASGEIFLTEGGKGISRRQIWREMKALCGCAGVAPSKVFPHNLRHLFATSFYQVSQDIVKLADLLGHSSIETTRIYLLTTGAEHIRQLERLGLIS